MLDKKQIEQIQNFLKLSSFGLFLQKEWGSQNPQHRELIKAQIQKFDFGSTSISHTEGMGGFCATQDPVQLGLDIEVIARVKPETVKRITHPQDDFEALSPAQRWAAKEAAFKALKGLSQPETASKISLKAVQLGTSKIFPVVVTGKWQAQGLVFDKDIYTLAVFKVS